MSICIPDRGTRFADMMPGERARCLEFARSHDWGDGARFDCDWRMHGLRDVSHNERDGWQDMPAFADTLGGLRDWAGY